MKLQSIIRFITLKKNRDRLNNREYDSKSISEFDFSFDNESERLAFRKLTSDSCSEKSDSELEHNSQSDTDFNKKKSVLEEKKITV